MPIYKKQQIGGVMITNEQLQLFEQRLDANPANAIAMNAVVHNGVVKSAISYEAFRQQRH